MRLIGCEDGSAYAWLLFFVGAFAISLIWFFGVDPVWDHALQTAETNNFVNVQGAMPLYKFFASIYAYMPWLLIILLLIGILKYASTRRGEI